eukprot:2101163-Pyramimonas_sp.AAC.1
MGLCGVVCTLAVTGAGGPVKTNEARVLLISITTHLVLESPPNGCGGGSSASNTTRFRTCTCKTC